LPKNKATAEAAEAYPTQQSFKLSIDSNFSIIVIIISKTICGDYNSF
jgi:hypothetical protein